MKTRINLNNALALLFDIFHCLEYIYNKSIVKKFEKVLTFSKRFLISEIIISVTLLQLITIIILSKAILIDRKIKQL